MKKKKTKIILTLCIIIGIIAVVGAGLKIPEINKIFGLESNAVETPVGAEVTKIPVTIEAVHKGIMERKIPLGGLLKASEQVQITAKNPAFRVTGVTVEKGDKVSVGTPLVYFDARDLDIQMSQAQLAYERNKQLFEAGALSKFQLEQSEIALENLSLQKENCTLASPISGIIAAVNVVEGQLAGATPLVSVVNIDQLELEVMVSESHISKLEKGKSVDVSIPSVAQEPFKGVITLIAPQINISSKAFPVVLTINNKNNLLKDGMYGEIQLVTDRKENILVIPQFAVVDYEQKKVVYVVENETAKMREVQLGFSLGDEVEVLSGLGEGEMLIVEGQYGVRDGSAVVPVMRGEE